MADLDDLRPFGRPSFLATFGVLGIASLLFPLSVVLAQVAGASPEDPLSCLERQRALHTEVLEAEKRGDAFHVASLYSEMAALPHLIPLFDQADSKNTADELIGRARAVLSGAAQKSVDAEKALVSTLGAECQTCNGYGFVPCPRCKGVGTVDVQVGRKTRREECVPWEACAACKGVGRQSEDVGIVRELSALVDLSMTESQRKDFATALKNLMRALKGRDLKALTLPIPSKDRLRGVLGRVPVDFERLKEEQRSELKDTWALVTPYNRRAAVQGYALDCLRFQRLARFLEGAPEPPALQAFQKTAKLVDWDAIRSGQVALGEPVRLVVTGRVPDEAFLKEARIPFSGRIAAEGPDPLLLVLTCYTPEDLDALQVLAKSQQLLMVEKLLQKYPPRAVPKALKELGPGRPIQLSGRLLRNPNAPPLFVFEVWAATAPERAGG